MPTRDAVGRTRSLLYGPEVFTYLPESNSYICPAGQQLNYGGRNERNSTFGYIGTRKKCGPCEQRSQCTTGPFRYLAIPHERSSPAASAGSPNYTGVRTGAATAKESRGALRRTKESQSHRPPSAPVPQVEVRTRAVLPGSHYPEHQAAGPVPQQASDVTGSRHFIKEGRSRLTQLQSSSPKLPKRLRLFQHPQDNALIERLGDLAPLNSLHLPEAEFFARQRRRRISTCLILAGELSLDPRSSRAEPE